MSFLDIVPLVPVQVVAASLGPKLEKTKAAVEALLYEVMHCGGRLVHCLDPC